MGSEMCIRDRIRALDHELQPSQHERRFSTFRRYPRNAISHDPGHFRSSDFGRARSYAPCMIDCKRNPTSIRALDHELQPSQHERRFSTFRRYPRNAISHDPGHFRSSDFGRRRSYAPCMIDCKRDPTSIRALDHELQPSQHERRFSTFRRYPRNAISHDPGHFRSSDFGRRRS